MTTSQSPDLSSELILLVNDNPIQLDSIVDLLSLDGYSLLKADSAKRALQIMQSRRPDLVISDVIELCSRIKSDPATADIPVLLVSDLKYDDASALEGLEAGADESLAVDAPLSLLIKKVGRLMAQSRANRARHKDDTAAQESESQYRLLFESNPHPLLVYDAETLRFLTVNEKAITLYGYSREEFLSLTLEDIRSQDDLPEHTDGLSTREPNVQYSGLHRHKKKDGSIIETETYSNDILFQKRRARLVLAIDITERRRDEEAIRASEERFSKAFSASPVPMSITTYDEGRYIDVNESFLQNSGYTREEIIGRTTTDINLYADPGERARLKQILKEQGRIRNAEVRRRVKSGEVRVALASSEIINLDGEQCILTTTNDITDRRRLEEQLLHSQKMESVGRLAGGVAHDFNNLLTAIIGYGQLLLTSFDKSDPRYVHAEEIENAGKRAATLTNQLLAFSRKQVIKSQLLDLNAVVTNIEKMLQRLIGEDIELATVLRPDVGCVMADPGQIEQVLMNLAVNARDAMPRGGKLTIETSNTLLDENYAREHIGVQPGRYVMLAVSDAGFGMDKETQARIFEPFFTTKEIGKGTGLGLSTVYGIVKQSGGNIWVYSEPDRGTTFKIYLPFVDEVAATIKKSEPFTEPTMGVETILLVEDEEIVRKFTREILELNGYKVIEATGGEEALRIAQEYDEKIDLLVTDVVMPQIGGRALANAIGITRPDIKALYLSGYTDETMVQHGLLERATAFLQKPFTPQMLASKVREVLDEKIEPDPQ